MKTLILNNQRSYDLYMHYLHNRVFYTHFAKSCAEVSHLVAHGLHIVS